MKLEHLIVQHLYNNKSVTLQGIGTIHLDPSVTIPQEGDKNASVPENAFSFDYNLKAGEDDALIGFIMQQTRKIRPLASSDLESYSILAKQFLNIGKPLSIEGVGTIMKNQAGEYEFTQGQFVSPKMEDAPKQLKEKAEENISFESEAPKKSNNRGLLLFVFFLLFAALSALVLYYFIFKNKPVKNEPVAEQPVIPAKPDTLTATDTTHLAADTIKDTTINSIPATTILKDSINFRVVLKDFKDEASVNKVYEKLISLGHKVVVIKVDSTKYRLAMPFTNPLSDTARKRDSLKQMRFFKDQPYIITQ